MCAVYSPLNYPFYDSLMIHCSQLHDFKVQRAEMCKYNFSLFWNLCVFVLLLFHVLLTGTHNKCLLNIVYVVFTVGTGMLLYLSV